VAHTNQFPHNAHSLSVLAAQIVDAHAAATSAAMSALEHARRAGELLIEAKDQLEHGAWLPWLSENCPTVSVRTAQNYMAIARCWPDIADANTQRVAHFTVGGALAHLATLKERRPSKSARAARAQWADLPDDERQEVRRMFAELQALPFTPRTVLEASRGRGGDIEIVGGAAGAPVYWDIVGGDPKGGCPTFHYSRKDVERGLYAFIDNGRRSVVSDLAVDVARRRLRCDPSLSRPSLPPDAGDSNTVRLGAETLSHLGFLMSAFSTATLEDTVAEAVRFARFSWEPDAVFEPGGEARSAGGG